MQSLKFINFGSEKQHVQEFNQDNEVKNVISKISFCDE